MNKGYKAKLLVVGVACVAVIFALILNVPTSQAGIQGSKHDFSETTWATNKICDPCHTPHDSVTGGAPLWNHSNSTYAATSYTMYNNTNGTQDSAVPSAVSSESMACLSCHDGTMNIDAFAGAAGSTKIGAAYEVGNGNTLAADHPISFSYTPALAVADGGLYNPTGVAAVAALLVGDRVECGSCHDVHNGTGLTNLLTVTMVDSALCLTCHDK